MVQKKAWYKDLSRLEFGVGSGSSTVPGAGNQGEGVCSIVFPALFKWPWLFEASVKYGSEVA